MRGRKKTKDGQKYCLYLANMDYLKEIANVRGYSASEMLDKMIERDKDQFDIEKIQSELSTLKGRKELLEVELQEINNKIDVNSVRMKNILMVNKQKEKKKPEAIDKLKKAILRGVKQCGIQGIARVLEEEIGINAIDLITEAYLSIQEDEKK